MLILTPNQRLSRVYREKYDNLQKTAGFKTWPSLEIYPIDTWIVLLWQKLIQNALLTPQYLLNSTQKQILWQNIIEEKHPNFSHLSSLALKTWIFIHQGNIDFNHIEFSNRTETLYFQQWAKNYHALLGKNHWCDIETAYQQIFIQLTDIKQDLLPKEIIFLGFTDFCEREKQLCTLLKNNNVVTSEQYYKIPTPEIVKISHLDEFKEIESTARWAIQQHQQNKKVACVFPELSTYKNKILATFERYNHDEFIDISLGTTLSEYPLIRSLFLGLNSCVEKIDSHKITDLLLSPFYTFSQPYDTISNRAVLDTKLQSDATLIFNTKNLLQHLHIDSEHFIIKPNKHYSPKEWLIVFQERLTTLGFLKNYKLNSLEHQLIHQWHLVGKQFCQLSIIFDKLNISRAIYFLNSIAKNIIFQPKKIKTSKLPQIEILGMIEASGLIFDEIWIAGCHDNAWPPHSKHNPFIPTKLISPKKINEQFYQKLTNQLLCSAKKIIISYPELVNHAPTQPSSFVINIKPITPHLLEDSIHPIKKTTEKIEPIELETIDDSKAPPLNINNLRHQGSDIIKDQAACHFRAFAKHRLAAKKIERTQIGLKATEKGNFIHQILEKVFEKITDFQELSKYTPQKLRTLIRNAIDKTVLHHSSDMNHFFISVETNRLENLIIAWITRYEKSRKTFQVYSREEKTQLTLGKLPLKLRIDRIDKINDEHYIIIDYKTGKTTVKIDPLEEPQLPLYCIAKNDLPIKEVVIAQVRTNDMRFKPIAAQKESWNEVLTAIAESYVNGSACVNPRKNDSTCYYCDLASVCRIKSLK